MGLPAMGVADSSLYLGPFLPLVVSFSFDLRVCALSYCTLLGHVHWISLGGVLLFFGGSTGG